MTSKLLLGLTLTLGACASAQSVTTIPAIPPGSTAPATPASQPADPSYPSGYRLSQLQAASAALEGLPGLTAREIDPAQGRLRVSVGTAVQRVAVLQRLTQAGLPTGLVTFAANAAGTATTPATSVPAPGPSSLPVGPTLGQAHRAELVGPTTLSVGQTGEWTLRLTNTGRTRIHLEHGACDLKFEVLDTAGKIVRPAVTNTLCTLQIVVTDVAPGETRPVLSFRWDGKDANGQPLPAGRYTLRAAFWDRHVSIRPPAVGVTLR